MKKITLPIINIIIAALGIGIEFHRIGWAVILTALQGAVIASMFFIIEWYVQEANKKW